MAQKKTKSKKQEKDEDVVCPVCQLMGCFRDMSDKESPFYEHMNKSWIEFLEGVRCLIDHRIRAAKKSGKKKKKSRMTKVKVQD